MIGIHVTPDDLRRVTIAGPDQLSELVSSANGFMNGHLPVDMRRRIASDVTPAARPLLQLVSSPWGFPDFLTPGARGDFEAGLDAALSTPDEQLRTELAPFECLAWTRDPDRVRDLLRSAVRAYRRAVFAAIRGTMLAAGGVDLLLATLHPDIDWTYPVLTLPCVDKSEYHLHGQGLRLAPTHFQALPSIIDRPDGPFEVYYPARADVHGVNHARGPLTPLLGRTRAAVLMTVGAGATTSQIALRVGISLASASEHATVLRNAGLVASGRLRNTVVHALTPLGADLVTTTSV
jgi:DNA-binding transcriptional ArsR family regulator